MLNYQTLLLVLIVLTTMTTLLFIAAALATDALEEQRLWAFGSVSISLGFALGAWNTAPVLVHAGLSYALMGLGLSIGLRGVRLFCGQQLRWRWVALMTLLAFVLPAYFAVVAPDKAARMVVTGLYLGPICWASAFTLVRGMHGYPWSILWAGTVGFVLAGLMPIARATYLLLAPWVGAVVVGPEQLETIAAISMLVAASAQVTISFGLVMLVSHRYSEKLSRLTRIDGLTGALNRVGMEHMGDRMLMRARQNRRSVCVAMVDADHFKAINDTHGHLAGDQVLVHLAGVLANQVRPGDLVIRYGGEEFVLLLDNSTFEDAAHVAERMRRAVEDSTVATPWGQLRYRVSIGLSCSDTSGHQLQRLVEAADAALYKAKQAGRNRVWLESLASQASVSTMAFQSANRATDPT